MMNKSTPSKRKSQVEPDSAKANRAKTMPLTSPVPVPSQEVQEWRQKLIDELRVRGDPPPVTEEYDPVAWKEFLEKNKSSYCLDLQNATQRSCPKKLPIKFTSFWGEAIYTIGCDESIESFLATFLDGATTEEDKQLLSPKDVVLSTYSYFEDVKKSKTTPRLLFQGSPPPIVLHVKLTDEERHDKLRQVHQQERFPTPDYGSLRGSAYLVSPNDPSYLIGPEAIEVGEQVGDADSLHEGYDTGRGWYDMLAALHKLVDSIPSYTTEQVTSLLLCMHRWDDWRRDARGMCHNEKCRLATKVLTEKLANAISKHVSKIVSSTDHVVVEEANEEGLGSVQAKSQLQRALLAINEKWNGCFKDTLLLFQPHTPRAGLPEDELSVPSAHAMDEMVAVAREWVVGTPSDECIRKLLSSLSLQKVETKSVKVTDIFVHEELLVEFKILKKDTYHDKKYPPVSGHHTWSVSWFDCDSDLCDSPLLLFGSFFCDPFMEDPPTRGYPGCANVEGVKKWLEKRDTAGRTIREGWNLKRMEGLKNRCMDWRRGASIPHKDMSWEDAARCVCAGVGILARDHPGNRGEWVLKRLMLRLERELRALNNKDAPDPNEMEVSEKLRYYGGCLNAEVAAALEKEARWDRPEKS